MNSVTGTTADTTAAMRRLLAGLLWLAVAALVGAVSVGTEAEASPAGRGRVAALLCHGCDCTNNVHSGCCCESDTPVGRSSEPVRSSVGRAGGPAVTDPASPRGDCECRANDAARVPAHSGPRPTDDRPQSAGGGVPPGSWLAWDGPKAAALRPIPAPPDPSKSPIYLRIARLLI